MTGAINPLRSQITKSPNDYFALASKHVSQNVRLVHATQEFCAGFAQMGGKPKCAADGAGARSGEKYLNLVLQVALRSQTTHKYNYQQLKQLNLCGKSKFTVLHYVCASMTHDWK